MNPPSAAKAAAAVSLLVALHAGFTIPTARGDVTFSFNFGNSTPEEQQVRASVAEAAAIYNTYGSFNKHWNVFYHPGIPTAEANYDGYMGYGGQRTTRVVLHEAAHTFGMGTISAYFNLLSGGVWQGEHGNRAQFDTYNDFGDGLHGDNHAIWPGGMNFENEDGFIERIWHLRIMASLRADMGILAFTREAQNELVHPGQTAEFRVESPVAAAYQWFRNGVALTDGGDISGARTPILRIANAAVADEGSYHCAASGAGETLASRARQLWVDPSEQLAWYPMNNNVADSAKSHHGVAFGSPTYTSGRVGQAINLDGIDDYIELPDAVGQAKSLTVATWINWDGGGNWQRVFDFGTGIYQHMFLTPRSGDGTARLAFRDSINGVDTEYRIDTNPLPSGQWVHLAAVLDGNYATLYVNGRAVGSNFAVPTRMTDFPTTRNYIGRSQYPDPLFDGRVDEFRIYNQCPRRCGRVGALGTERE